MNKRLDTSSLSDGLRGFFSSLRLTLVESVFLIAALLFASLVAFYYLTKIQPRYSEIAELKSRLQVADAKITEQGNRGRQLVAQRTHKEKILDSLADFEEMLKDRVTGQTQMVAEINRLARAHNLMTPGISFQSKGSEIASVTPTVAPDAEPGGSPTPTPPPLKLNRELTVYPSLGIDTSVESDYRNLRRFIYDLERSRQFLIINAVAFQGVDENTRVVKARPAPAGAGAAAEQGGQNIGLKIELDAFFQKPEGMRAFIYPASVSKSPEAKATATPDKSAK
jgi:hypothetical protein